MTDKILFRGGCILTLGAKTPNFAQADLLIEGDRVAEVGTGIRARDAEQVDASDTIVMPGFVDTHRHAWKSLLRNLGRSDTGGASMSSAELGEHHAPEDVYAATLIGLLGAVEAGITTVVDWADLPPDPAYADAALQAHADAGLRTVLVHASRHATRETLAHLAEAAGPETTVTVGLDGLEQTDDRLADLWEAARELGAQIQVHLGSGTPGPISTLSERGLMGDHVTFVHIPALQDRELDAIASSGASVSLTPSSEMAGGLGSPRIQQLIDRDIRLGLGVDDERVAPGDMFAQMRATISLQHATVFDLKLAGKAGLPRLMSTRDVIRSATVDGARVAGLGGVTGSLEPGMQADVIVLRTDRPNIFPINDPIGAVVWGMDTSNVDRVVVGGRILMRDGELQADVGRARAMANTARERVVAASGISVGVAPGAAG